MMKLASQTQQILFVQVLTGILSFVATVEIARVTGATIYGLGSTFLLILSVLLDISDFGACSWAARELRVKRINITDFMKIRKIKSRIAWLYLLLIPVFSFLDSSGSNFIFLFAFYPVLWIQFNYIQQYFVMEGKLRTALKLQILERVCWLSIFIIPFLTKDRIALFILPVVLGLYVHALVGSLLILISIEKARASFRPNLFNLFYVTRHFGFISVLSDINNLDAPIIAKLATLGDAGSYSLTQRFRNPLQIAFQTCSVRLRKVAADRRRDQIAKIWREDFPLLILSTFGIVIVAIVMLLQSEKLFGASFVNLNQIMFIGILTAIPMGFGNLSNAFLGAIGEEAIAASMTGLQSFLTLVGLVPMTIFLGVEGSVAFVFLVNFFFASVLLIIARREFRKLALI